MSVIGRLNLDSFVRERVREGYSHQAIASELEINYPASLVGLSRRSVTRYCSLNNIHYSSRLQREQLNDVVEQAVYRITPLFAVCVCV